MTLHDILGLLVAAPLVFFAMLFVYAIYRDWHQPGVKEGVATGIAIITWSLAVIAWNMTKWP